MNSQKRYWDGKNIACQGDINLISISEIGLKSEDISRQNPIDFVKGRVMVGEGEVTGHSHAFFPQPIFFRDDGMARELAQNHQIPEEENKAEIKFFQDDKAILKSRFSMGAQVVGFVELIGGPATLRHANEDGTHALEHADIVVPEGIYVVFGKREWDAGKERRVID